MRMTKRGWRCSRSRQRTWVLTARCRSRCMLPLRFFAGTLFKHASASVLASSNRTHSASLYGCSSAAMFLCSNVPFARLKELMGSSAVGIHTMWNGTSITRHECIAIFQPFLNDDLSCRCDSGSFRALRYRRRRNDGCWTRRGEFNLRFCI